MKALSREEINKRLEGIDGWAFENNAIKKTFKFRDFNENFGFMSRVAMLAEQHNHHPDWSGGYNNLTVCLSTHDAGGVSEKDFALAIAIERL